MISDQVDRLEERESNFFTDCLKKLKKSEDKEIEFSKIKDDYKKAIEDATEKVQVAEECYGLVDRYLRKLDEELHKFKMELEADNRGITEVLEKQSLEMDAQNVAHLKENRLPKKLVNTWLTYSSWNTIKMHILLSKRNFLICRKIHLTRIYILSK
jgi:inhibitor of growth protein 3